MLANNPDRDWETIGATDPYFGVLTDARYRRRELDEQALIEFFRSGEAHLETVADAVRRVFGVELGGDRALDVGCGVGRVVVALARRFQGVVGTDVSLSMLAEARRNCDRAQVGNVELLEADDALSRVSGTFDFVHSFIVFQHIPVARGEAVTRRLVALLRPEGIGALHYTYCVASPPLMRAYIWAQVHLPLVQRVINLIRQRPGAPLMQMNEYSLSRLTTLLHEAGCDEIYSRATLHGGARGLMLIFRKRALGSL